MAFRTHEVLPNVYQIEDCMGVCITLLKGTEKALLIDTGYGMEDVNAAVRQVTDLPFEVLLTHGHHDHVLGAMWFAKTKMFAEDCEEFALRTGREQRQKVMGQARDKRIEVPAGYEDRPVPMPEDLCEGDISLGGLTARIMKVPGHTVGSFVVFVPERNLLLSGDDWNPCTWLWFPCSIAIHEWKKNMERVMELPFTHVLCSHQYELQTREKMQVFMDGITDESIQSAEKIPLGGDIDTRIICLPDECVMVFDYGKASNQGETNMKTIRIDENSKALFNNNAAYCVGTGRMGLAMQKEYLDQLKMAQKEAGFSHIRGHGLFCDDMSIYQPTMDEEGNWHDAYCFTYLDRVMDAYKEAGIRPFLELGFMPSRMASGTQTIFYWKGNTTPPKDDTQWANLVKATLKHLADRYGYEEVSSWPAEVWNEPNLPGFWENADEEKYHHLYAVTAKAVKEVLPEMKVGGPAVCGGPVTPDWIRNFLTFCRDEKLPLDFVTRHAYMGNNPEHHGRYLYHEMRAVEDTYAEMKGTREIIDSFPEYRGMDMHITEFNTSYNPFCPIHDTNLNAVYIAGLLACLGDVAASYSYWTFGDVFEEMGVPSRPFHGGFGMIADQLIPKPTLWTFAFFNNLKGEAVYRDENAIIVRDGDRFEGVLWNLCREERKQVELAVKLPCAEELSVLTRTVDEECCNPLKLWHEMGEPASLNDEQLALLRESARPEASCLTAKGENGEAELKFLLKENGLIHFTATPKVNTTDPGYDYEWYRVHS